ncbi:glycosyltransferase [Flavobacterium sp. GSB-24]|uniref:glycosyltransferase n=1 Tax=Flavobacterium sp. GSB-24 TaxID=2994319 RepID=UPI0024923F4C|nr:glycosyltransferase [Flavobacterium sp. GSB-24]BDU23579.1 hypothetical protein FLGSB24_03230 [Flavobacterium sp. GSB-24]
MVNKKNILLITSAQYGYHTDSYFYADLLSKYYNVFYLGYDHGGEYFETKNVHVFHVPFKLGKIKSRIAMMKLASTLHKKETFTHTMIFYFTFSSLFKFCLGDSIQIMDIRTSFVFNSKLKRYAYNRLMCLETSLFKHVTIISKSLQKYLRITKEAHVLPLGAPDFITNEKEFSSLKLMYVGTFYDRNIEQTVFGFHRFLIGSGFPKDVKYTIIGFGSEEEKIKINNAIKDNNLEEYIDFKGEIRYPALTSYFLESNVGISFIPLTSYYDCQPPTKTFEYLLNGMAVLATKTSENALVINRSNGVLIGDSTQEFSEGLVELYRLRKTFNSNLIKQKASKFTWEYIVENNLHLYLESLQK